MSLPPARLAELRLPPLLSSAGVNEDAKGTAYHLTIDANSKNHPTSTGISAHDRAYLARLVASGAGPEEFTRPGHVVPLRYTTGGTRKRVGHTEAAVGEYRERSEGGSSVKGIPEIEREKGRGRDFVWRGSEADAEVPELSRRQQRAPQERQDAKRQG